MFSDLASVEANDHIQISGAEAHHAVRVKRINTGQKIGLIDGCGRIASATLTDIAGSKSKPRITIEIAQITRHPKPTPAVEIWSALPKGDRLDRMIDQISQIGVAAYRPLLCDRSQRKPDTIRTDKLERIAVEAAKQCRRPWVLDIQAPISFADAIKDPDAVIADASGDHFVQESAKSRVVLLIGPQGGWSDDEREQFAALSLPTYRFGLYVLRIEAAACAASAIVLATTQGIEIESGTENL